MRILGVRDNPGICERAAAYLAEKWGNRAIYDDCLVNSLNTPSPLPRRFVMLNGGGDIIGCCRLIANDFNSRQDLWPWLAALFVEESERGKGYGGALLNHARGEAAMLGYDKMYLATDHEGYTKLRLKSRQDFLIRD